MRVVVQMSFMRKKLEEQYQGKLDEMEAELDETRDESEALRVQIKMLMGHVEQVYQECTSDELSRASGWAWSRRASTPQST